MSYNNISYEDDNSISNMFAKYFNTFYFDTHISKIASHAYSNTYNSQLNISIIFISLQNVYKALSTIGNNYKAGPDLLPEILFKNCFNALPRPIQTPFQFISLIWCLSNFLEIQLYKSYI
jgi:hypothetical protein